jgi:hypothetical protein
MKKKFEVLGEFLGHLFIGAVMFASLLLTGAALSHLVHLVSDWLHDPMFGAAMRTLERVLLFADMLFMLWWTGYSTYKAIKELNHE